jgi:hypothetical protein
MRHACHFHAFQALQECPFDLHDMRMLILRHIASAKK